MTTDSTPAIGLEGVTLGYSGERLFENLSAQFPRQSLTALLGSSGSGKSTLLRTFCRMNDRLSGFEVQGQVRVLGEDIHARDTDVYELRRRVGMVFQKPCVFPRSVYENVVFGLHHHAPQRKREFPDMAEQALRQAYLWDEVKDRLKAPAPTLSQGQQQRLSIARTLAIEPEILLLDEPTASLDPRATEKIEELIHSLRKDHSLVLVTHDPDQACRLADRVYHVRDRGIGEASGQPKPLPLAKSPSLRISG